MDDARWVMRDGETKLLHFEFYSKAVQGRTFVEAELGEAFVVSVQGLNFAAANSGEVALDLEDGVSGAFATLEFLLLGIQRGFLIFACGTRGVNLIKIGADSADVVVDVLHDGLFLAFQLQDGLLDSGLVSPVVISNSRTAQRNRDAGAISVKGKIPLLNFVQGAAEFSCCAVVTISCKSV